MVTPPLPIWEFGPHQGLSVSDLKSKSVWSCVLSFKTGDGYHSKNKQTL